MDETDYTIVQRFQSVLKGLTNTTALPRTSHGDWSRPVGSWETSLLKDAREQTQVFGEQDRRDVSCPQPEYKDVSGGNCPFWKGALVATFGGMSLRKNPDGRGGNGFRCRTWHGTGLLEPVRKVVMHLHLRQMRDLWL